MPCAIMRGREPAGSVQHARALSEVARVNYQLSAPSHYRTGVAT